MMNVLGKSLVFIHTVFSIMAMTYGGYIFMRGRDIANNEPRKEAIEWNAENVPTKFVRHASDYDKSVAALKHADETRNRAYIFVKPALERLRDTEPNLPYNHLQYVTLIDRLRNSPDKLEVRRLKDGGLEITRPVIGKPITEENAVEGLNKSYRSYEAELNDLTVQIKKVDEESKAKISEAKRFVRELTGTDEGNKFVEPGLYQLLDQEFKAQTQLRVEIEDIKPFWSKANEQARLFVYRRSALEGTLQKLKGAAPKVENKK